MRVPAAAAILLLWPLSALAAEGDAPRPAGEAAPAPAGGAGKEEDPFVPLRLAYQDALASCKEVAGAESFDAMNAIVRLFKEATADPPPDPAAPPEPAEEAAKKAARRKDLHDRSVEFFRSRVSEAKEPELWCVGRVFVELKEPAGYPAVKERVAALLSKEAAKPDARVSRPFLELMATLPDGSGTDWLVDGVKAGTLPPLDVYPALGRSRSPRAFHALLEGYLDPRDEVQVAAQLGFQDLTIFLPELGLNNAAAVSELMMTLPHVRFPTARVKIIHTLAVFKDPAAIPLLLEQARDQDPQIRAGVAESLRAFRDDPRVEDALMATLGADEAILVRQYVVASMREMKSPRFVPFLIERLKEDGEHVDWLRDLVVRTLETITGQTEFKQNWRRWRDWWLEEEEKRARSSGAAAP